MSVWDDTDALTAEADYLDAMAEEYADAESFDERYGDEIEGRAEPLSYGTVPDDTSPPALQLPLFDVRPWSMLTYAEQVARGGP